MINIFPKKCVALLGGAILLLVCVHDSTGLSEVALDIRESDYTVFARGLRVGDLKTVCTVVPYNEKHVLKFEATTHVNVNFLFYLHRFDKREEALIGDRGAIRYQLVSRDRGKVCEVEGRLDHGRFLLSISENGVKRNIAVERDKYDCTSMECPEIAMKREGEEMKLRLLDLESQKVVIRSYRWVKSEDMTVDGRKISCRVVDFEDENKKCRRWIRPDILGAIIVRQDGRGKEGTYSLRMEHLKDGV